jgi:hypothetical protein
LDGSYLHCDKRIADAGPADVIWFDDSRKSFVAAYLKSPEARPYLEALEATAELIDGFESPLGMELLATVDWLLHREHCAPTVEGIKAGLANWPGGANAAGRKMRLFDDSFIDKAIERLTMIASA